MTFIDSFIETDSRFLKSFRNVGGYDPIGFCADSSGVRFQTETDLADVALNFAMRATDVVTSAQTEPKPDELATFRDLDKVFGYFAHRREVVPDDIAKLFSDYGPQSSRPRCNTYEYFLGSDPSNPSHLYTGRAEEVHLIDITAKFLSAGHVALHRILEARRKLRLGRSAFEELSGTYEELEIMRKSMTRAYREVTPEFVTQTMTGRMRGVNIGRRRLEGPNASHSVSLLVDRFVLGSFKDIEEAPGMREAISSRLIGLPPHLIDLFEYADEAGEFESIVELCVSLDDKELATKLVAQIRKGKVAHKSFADKGSRFKALRDSGGADVIVPNDRFTDILTPTIEALRAAEIT